MAEIAAPVATRPNTTIKTPGWNPWLSVSWDQQLLANSFGTIALHSPPSSV
jgi:hypothetical protein